MKDRASGKFVVRIDPSLHRELRETGARERISLNELCSRLLARTESKAESENPLLRALRTTFGANLLGVVLFGSRARGQAKKESDWDVLIVLSGSVPIRAELYRIWDKELESQVESGTSPHFCHLPQDLDSAGSLWFEVAIDGIILEDHNQCVLHTLQQLRRMMAEGRIQRKMSYGHPYWVKHPSSERKGA